MSQAQKNTASLDRLILEWAIAAEEAAKDTTGEKWLDESGKVKSKKRSEIIQQIRETGGYEAVLTSSEKSVGDYNEALAYVDATLGKLKSKDGINEALKDLDVKKIK